MASEIHKIQTNLNILEVGVGHIPIRQIVSLYLQILNVFTTTSTLYVQFAHNTHAESTTLQWLVFWELQLETKRMKRAGRGHFKIVLR